MKKRKLYYVPGLISAVVLPLLLIYFDLHRPAEHNVLQFFVPSDKEYPGEEERFTRKTVYKHLAKKKKNVVSLQSYMHFGDPDRNAFINNSNREFLVDEFRKLKFSHDTTEVLEVRLTEESTYGDFIFVINLAVLFDIRRYVWIDNSIYLFHPDPPAYSYGVIDVYPELPFVVVPDRPTAWEIFWQDVRYKSEIIWWYVKYHYITVIGFVLLIVIPGIIGISRLRRRLSQRSRPVSSRAAV